MFTRNITYQNDKSFFLFGPRGTGKSTWVRKEFPNAIYLDLLEASLYNSLLANPERLRGFIPPGFKDWVIIDEVQKVPELLNEVHRLIESQKLRFVLTGSSARKLRRSGVNLLGGRALTNHMHPLMASELGKDFSFSHSLRYGFMPCVYTESAPEKYLASYVSTYLKEEIQQEGLTRNIGAFSRFLEVASFSQGCELNISEIARVCAINRKVVENYFSILDDLLLAIRLPVFSRRAKRNLTAHPKFFFFDVGAYRAIRPTGPLDSPEEIEGAALETLVLQQLLALNDNLQLGYAFHHWRTSTKLEVDLVLYGERGLHAFEVKRSARLRNADFSGLKTFKSDYPAASTYLLYRGERKYFEGNIQVVPIELAISEFEQML